MHTRTKRKQHRAPRALLYPLPEAESAVKSLAFSQGLIDAVQATRKGARPADATVVAVAAQSRCHEYQAHHLDGKAGTNDPRLFQELFLPTYTRAREAMARQVGRLPPLPTDVTRLATYFYAYVEAHPEIVESAYVGDAFDLPPFP